MQAVYISNRPTIFADTLGHVALFMPFIKAIVVCVPDKQKQDFQAMASSIPIQVVAESEVLDSDETSNFRGLDHQRRNYLLRSRLIRSDKVDAQFIMSDDDARPLKPIGLDRFIKDGRYRRYFFYDLASWGNNQTEFDAGQIATCAVLDYENLEHLSYASHMPQMINKNLFIAANEFFAEHQKNHPLCEWSTYFNYAPSISPEKFHQPEAFKTICWPEHPLAWKLFIEPQSALFENFTPSLYEPTQAFAKFTSSTEDADVLAQENINKVIRWRKYQIALRHPEQSPGLLKFLKLRTWVNKVFEQ